MCHNNMYITFYDIRQILLLLIVVALAVVLAATANQRRIGSDLDFTLPSMLRLGNDFTN